MNILFFGLKRAHHGTLRFTRSALACLGLTAARFDLLYVLLKSDGIMLQSDLRRVLGVAAPTVSRMLASLEELGLLKRKVLEEDHRHREVTLTKTGRRCVRNAARRLVHTGHVQLAIDAALCRERWTEPLECDLATGRLNSKLNALRHAFRDLATRNYPGTYPEDFEDLPTQALWFTSPEEDR